VDSLKVPFGNGRLEGSGGSGVEIFMESGDCDLEFGDDSGGCELLASAFLIADGPSGIDDWGGRTGVGCATSEAPACTGFNTIIIINTKNMNLSRIWILLPCPPEGFFALNFEFQW
jgi:hypothetical protein